MTRRTLFAAILCLAALPAFARTPPATAMPAGFSWEKQTVADQVRENLASRADLDIDLANAMQSFASGLGVGAFRRLQQSQWFRGAGMGAQCLAKGDREESVSLAQVLTRDCQVHNGTP